MKLSTTKPLNTEHSLIQSLRLNNNYDLQEYTPINNNKSGINGN